MKLRHVMKELQRVNTDIRLPLAKNTYLVENQGVDDYNSDIFINNAQVSLNTHKSPTYFPITEHVLEELVEDAGLIRDDMIAQHAGLSIACARLEKFQHFLAYRSMKPPEGIHAGVLENMHDLSGQLRETYGELQRYTEEVFDDYIRDNKIESFQSALLKNVVETYVDRIRTGNARR